jgi:hypothetical protein
LSSPSFIGTALGVVQGLALQLDEDAPLNELPRGVIVTMRADTRGCVV